MRLAPAPLRRLLLGAATSLLPVGAGGLAWATPLSSADPSGAPAGLISVVATLMAQAHYWDAQHQPAQALDALKRVLALDPTNTDALTLQARIQLAAGNAISAQQTLATLRQVQPNAPSLSALERLQKEVANPVDQSLINQARAAAQTGHPNEAVKLYQQAFHGGAPPSAYASEYYQTLAGTEGGYGTALNGLGSLVSSNPDDLQNQLAFAKAQTYRTETRTDGITRLQRLTAYPSIADQAKSAWEQALSYLPSDGSSLPYFKAYLDAYPNDPNVSALLANALKPQPITQAQTEAQKRSAGFVALNAGQLTNAAALFQAALVLKPDDADALGGLGLVKLRQGQTVAAQDLLRRAIAANPDGAAQWQSALQGASRGAAYANASALTNQGDLAGAARQLNQIIAAGGNVTGTYAMLANVQTQQGDLTGAASSWRAVLARDPNNNAALVGLGAILARQGDQQGAKDLFQRATANGGGALVAAAQADVLRNQAKQATDPTVTLALYRSAVAAAPDDPWARLDLARALHSAGQDAEAEQVMAAVTSGPNLSVADLQAGALFAAEEDRQADALAFIAQLPPSGLNAAMQAIEARGQIQQQIVNIQAQSVGNEALARQLLVTAAAKPDPDGARGAAIAKALFAAGDTTGAELAIQAAIAANNGGSNDALIAYAGTLLGGGADMPAAQIINSLQSRNNLSGDQQLAMSSIRDGLAVRASDRLAAQGKLADAYQQLAPDLTASPQDPSLNMALARLYADNHQPHQALAINEALLRNDPGNLDARAGAIDAAIAARDWVTAASLVQDGEASQPNEPRIWMMAADVARAQGDDGEALNDLRTAQNLRQQQLAAQSSAGPVLVAATVPLGTNPFGTPSSRAVTGTVPSILSTAGDGVVVAAAAAQPDPMSQQIAAQIADLQQTQDPKIQAGISVDDRSGSGGLDELTTIGAPIVGSYAPHGWGKLEITATPTFLAAGQLSSDPAQQSQFGSDALDVSASPSAQNAAGIAIAASYSLPWLKLHIGSTPFGFKIEHLVGGAELDPSFGNGIQLRLTASREAVTDSLLSYAGTRDPTSGTLWGGVVRDRAAGQVSVSAGPGYVYAGGGFDQLTGTHVAKNSEIEFGAGSGYPIFHTDTTNTQLGLNLTYFSYQKNLRYFTLGQGGYFSPQSYFAASIPLDYKETDGSLTWSVGGAIGVQSYSENASPYYPIDPGLQGQLVAAAAASTYLKSEFPSDTTSGVIGDAHCSFEYQLDDGLVVGGNLDYDRTGNWNNTQALVYARFLLGNKH